MICEITGYGRKGLVKVKSQQEEQRVWHSSNMVNLCLDHWSEKEQRGKLYHVYTKEPIVFDSLLEAVNRMEELYDGVSVPQASTNPRSFWVDRGTRAGGTKKDRTGFMEEVEGFDQVIRHRGMQATFLIHVMYRQHSSWQGEVTWVDRQKKEYFRSVLELIRLMDSAFHTKGNKDAE